MPFIEWSHSEAPDGRLLRGNAGRPAGRRGDVQGGAGQTLTVELKGSDPQNHFNVMAAGSDTPMFIGSMSGHRFSGLLAMLTFTAYGDTLLLGSTKGTPAWQLSLEGLDAGTGAGKEEPAKKGGGFNLLKLF
jgi:hypothetical protein